MCSVILLRSKKNIYLQVEWPGRTNCLTSNILLVFDFLGILKIVRVSFVKFEHWLQGAKEKKKPTSILVFHLEKEEARTSYFRPLVEYK